MDLEQLKGRCLRLRQELLAAYRARPRNTGCIARLTNDLASAERDTAALVASQQHGDEPLKRAA